MSCSDGRGFKGFRIRQQERDVTQKIEDYTAANSLAMICKNEKTLFPPNEGNWGAWRRAVYCHENLVICGLRVQFQPYQGSGDDVALANVDFQCCSIN